MPAKPTLVGAAELAGGSVSSVDARGVPTFIWATGDLSAPHASSAQEAARGYLARFAGAQALLPSDVAAAEVQSVNAISGIGVITRFTQRVGGVEVYPSRTTVLVRENMDLVAISGRLTPATSPTKDDGFALAHAEALAIAIEHATGAPLGAEALIELAERQGDFVRFDIARSSAVHLPEPARAKRIYHATNDILRPAYFVEMYVGTHADVDSEALRYLISATDGRVLDRRDLTAHEAYNYRVWADTTGDLRPHEGPQADYSPHPTGIPDNSLPALVPSVIVNVEAFNRAPTGGVDPWLPNGSMETTGNNVDAYADHNAPDGYSNGDTRAERSATRTFDWVYDPAMEPVDSEEQTFASVTQLFYTINWLHDDWYNAGFNEAAGNAQRNNFERGGMGGDALKAEAQDNHFGGARNNANMSTPSDGLAPRMQMYAWTGLETRRLTLTPGGVVPTGAASFGPRDFDLTGNIVLANDGSGVVTDACQPITNNVAGQIVLIDRGACAFVAKATNAQAAGAIGVIIGNNAPGNPPTLGGTGPAVTIGVISVSLDDRNAIATALQSGPVSATIFRRVEPDLDGSFDTMVVAHEWGHYLHHRLSDCGSTQCGGMSEGWGDFLALHTALREGDDLDGVYSAAIWATRGRDNGSYFGIRRVPFSTDPTKNLLSFRHIADGEPLPTEHPVDAGGPNSEVHNAGEIWASMLFEAYVDLQRTAGTSSTSRSFDDVRRRMQEYLVAGLMMMPTDATFTEARDGILAAVAAASPTDLQIVAEAFARRGAGSCAESPERYADDNRGVVESFEVSPVVLLGSITVGDSDRSCDDDGVLDADERGLVTVRISNGGPAPLTGTELTLTSTSVGVTFPAGATLTVPTIEPYRSFDAQVAIALDPTLTGRSTLALGIRVDSPDACTAVMTSTVVTRINVDDGAMLTTDDVEANGTSWTTAFAQGGDVWSRAGLTALEHVWHGLDFGGPVDSWLTTPSLMVGTGDFSVSMDHRYRFEADEPDGTGVNWDGAVVEISSDGGANWEDISVYADIGYRGVLTDTSGNPLAGRDALVGTSTAWPDFQRLNMNFGTTFAGQAVTLRFRIGTDAAVGDVGIQLDNISATGITNTPFIGLADDIGVCPIPLIANAGEDQTVDPGVLVVLDGTGSVSSQNLPLTYAWAQTAGPAATLVASGPGRTVFRAPVMETEETLTFELTVDDGTLMATDTVDVTVRAIPPVTLTADAGDDQTAEANQRVALDGTGTESSAGLAITYAWRQTAGTNVTIERDDRAVAVFTAPELEADETLTFELSVTDGVRTETDTVDVDVARVPPPPDPIVPIVAIGGPDVVKKQGDIVRLDGTASTGPVGLRLDWAQVDGPDVTFNSNANGRAEFQAAGYEKHTVLTFELYAIGPTSTATDTVIVTVLAPIVAEPLPTRGDEEGCECSATQPVGASSPLALLACVGLVIGLRRRRFRSI